MCNMIISIYMFICGIYGYTYTVLYYTILYMSVITLEYTREYVGGLFSCIRCSTCMCTMYMYVYNACYHSVGVRGSFRGLFNIAISRVQ